VTLKEPTSVEDCIYFTQRTFDNGKVKAWVYKGKCPECGKGIMGKPKDEKTGRPKIRAKEYQCPKCKYIVEKEKYESSLMAQIKYICPNCKNEGEVEIPFKRKKVQRFNEESGKKETVEALRIQCSKCKGNIDVTKKMK